MNVRGKFLNVLLAVVLVLSFNLVAATPAGATPGSYVATTGHDDTGDGSPGNPWLTIQHAITMAPGGTVNVAAGTYVEVGHIVIDNDLSIVGADKATTIIKPNADTGSSSDAKGWWLVNSGKTFNLSGVTLDGNGYKVFHGIRHKGIGTIQNVHFTNMAYNASGPDYAGFAIYAFGQVGAVNVNNCVFDNIGREGIAYWGAGTNGTYSGNTYTGKGLGNWLDYGVEVTNGAVATIANSTITNNLGTATLDGSNSAGIIVLMDGSTATITGNTINGNDIAIKVGYNTPVSSATAYAHNNSIYGNISGTLHGTAGGTFDATNNWWGAASGPHNVTSNPSGSGDTVSDNVNFDPWYNTAGKTTKTYLVGAGETFTTIQAAIDAASAGDTINVAAGAYTENVVVDKALTLTGASSATVTVTAASPTDSVFTVTASNVTISGFTATGTQMSGNNGYAGIKFGNGVTNCNIHDNILSTNQYGILLLEPLSNTTPGNNTFTNNTASGCVVSGIEMQNTWNNTFTNNTANSNGSQGFRLANSKNNTFTGNTANSNGTGFFLVVAGGTGSNNNTFTNNTANLNTNHGIRIDGSTGNTLTGNTCNSNGADGIKLKSGSNNNTLNNNTCTSNVIGIDIAEAGVDATTLTVTHNNITLNPTYGVSNLGTGILNATHNWWGAASGPYNLATNASGTGNPVSNNVNFDPWYTNAGMTTLSASTLYVDPIGNDDTSHGTATGTDAFKTIQFAINSASAGATISVAAGTYVEDLIINAKANLKLVGDAGATIQEVATFPASGGINNILIWQSDGVKIHGFTIQSPAPAVGHSSPGIVINSKNVEIYGNTFNVANSTATGDLSVAIQTSSKNDDQNLLPPYLSHLPVDVSGLNIHDNLFTSFGAGTVGYDTIYINPDLGTGTVTIANNQFTGYVFRGISTERSKTTISGNSLITITPVVPGLPTYPVGISLYNFNLETIDTVILTGNTIQGFSRGITMGNAAGTMLLTNISVTGNTVELNGTGIQVRSSANGVIVNYNNIDNNTIGVENADIVHTLDATHNWWGAASGPHNVTSNPSGAGNAVSDFVDFGPLLILPYGQVSTATSAGVASFSTSDGIIEDLAAVAEGDLPTIGKPSLTFPFGLFSFKITGLTPGETVIVTITLPSAVPIGTQYWKYQSVWFQVIPVGDDDGDSVITITLQDGGSGDSDLVAGTITDPSGPALPIDHYTVTSASYSQFVNTPVTVTVNAYDVFNNLCTNDSTTLVTMTASTLNLLFNGDGDSAYGEVGDNLKTLSNGTFNILVGDGTPETVTINATDGNSKTGSSTYTFNTPANLILTAPATATITASSLVPETLSGAAVSNAAVDTAIIGLTPLAVRLQNTGTTPSAVNVRISPIGVSSNIQFWAKDTLNNWYDVNVTGWGPPAGFAVPAGYDVSTNVYVISNTAGSYPLTINLVNAATSAVITSAPATVNVTPSAIDHYTVTSTNYSQLINTPVAVTVNAYDVYNNLCTNNSTTLVTMNSSTGHILFDGNGNNAYGESGDNVKTLSNGTFNIMVGDGTPETVTINATDANSKTGTSLTYTFSAPPTLTFDTGVTSSIVGPLPGTLATQFTITTANVPGSLHTLTLVGPTANPNLADGHYAFTLSASGAQQTILTNYFAAKGWPGNYVTQIATEINGTAPFFFVNAAGGVYTLGDGFTFGLGGGYAGPLRIDDDYPAGTYVYHGTLTGTNAATLPVTVTLVVAPSNLTFDTGVTSSIVGPLPGTLATQFTITTANVPGSLHTLTLVGPTANPNLADGHYAFTLSASGAQQTILTNYFAAKGWPGNYVTQIATEINGTAPFFFVNAAGGVYTLGDGFTFGLGGGYAGLLRIDDDYPAGTYVYHGTLIGTNSATLPVTVTLVVAPSNLTFDTGVTSSIVGPLPGTLATQFTITTANVPGSLHTLTLVGPTANPNLADGHYAFTLSASGAQQTTLTNYFAAKGWPGNYVTQIATEINGTAPFFFVNAAGGVYTLGDGFTFGLGGGYAGLLRIDDDYPAGTYVYHGTLTGTNSATLPVTVTLVVAPSNLTFDTGVTSSIVGPLPGTLATQFTITTANVPGSLHTLTLVGPTANPNLADGHYAFTLSASGAQQTILTNYFAAKGWPGNYVTQIATEINGTAPFFFVNAAGGVYTLGDGFTFGLGGGYAGPLRIDDDYPAGTYVYHGTLTGTNSATLPVTVTLVVNVNSTVTFDKNGGDTDASPTTRTTTYNGTVTLPTPPTKVGSNFSGWNTLANGSGSVFDASTNVTTNISVYAQWTVINYTVTFDKNGGDTDASPTTRTTTYNGTVTLPTPPTKVGSTFSGWNTLANGTGSVFDASTQVTTSITVYAQWTAIIYTVTFNKNGGDTDASPTTRTTTYNGTVTLPTPPTKVGSNFSGWNTLANGTGSVFDASTQVTASITVYAQWTAIIYTVTFNKNGGDTDASPTTRTTTYNGTVTLPTPPTKVGSNFSGWNTLANGTGSVFDASTQVTASITVYAQWTAIIYTVTFNKNGGDTDASPTTRTTTYNGTVTLPTPPTKVGSNFSGWNTLANGTGSVFDASTQVTASITVYAQWTAIIYTVTFNKNGGDTDASPTTRTTSYNGTVTLPTPPIKVGSNFSGWNTLANGSGSVFDASTQVTASITVYAQWTAIIYTITFNKNGGDTDASPTTRTTTYNGTVILPAPPTKVGSTFSGWNTLANGTGSVFTASTPVSASITVYAQWTAIIYTVTFNKNGGDTDASPTTRTTTYNGTVTLPTPPTKVGSTFSGWNTLANGTGSTFTASTPVTASITVYAQWAASTKAITAFNFTTPAVTGVINEGDKTIALTVPYGTAVTALVPTITITGVSVSPLSGVAQNFTNPVTYTVTAANTSTQAYTVTVSIGAVIQGTTWEAKGLILGGVTLTLDGTTQVISAGNGAYQLIAAIGSHTIVASKTGYRSQTQTIIVADLSVTYTLDFKADNGLVPNAPDISYVLVCINKWKFPPANGTGLDLSKVLSVINAWKFPIID